MGDPFQLGHIANLLSCLQGIGMKAHPPSTTAQTEYRSSSLGELEEAIEIERLFLDNWQQPCCRAHGRQDLHGNTVDDGSIFKPHVQP